MSTPPCAGFRYSSMQALDTMHNGTPLRSNANNVHTVQVCVQGAGTKALTNGRRLPKVKFAQCRGWQPHPVIIPSTKVRLSEGFRILLRLKSLKGLIGHSVMMSAIHFFAESTWLVLDCYYSPDLYKAPRRSAGFNAGAAREPPALRPTSAARLPDRGRHVH